MAKRLIITKEKHEILLIKQTNRYEKKFCNECEKEVFWLSAKKSAEVTGNAELEIYRLIEQGTIHYEETAKRTLIVCLESLSNRSKLSE